MSDKLHLNYLTQDALETLFLEFENNKIHYLDSDNSWFLEKLSKTDGLLESKIECDNFIDSLNSDDDYSISDFENVKTIYSALKDMSVSVASDQRLWSGLAHGQLWDFIKYRRRKEILSRSSDDIKISFFFTRGKRRSIFINCLSRLWWTGYLTYDEFREDPYELTKLVCERAYASTIMLLSSNNFVSKKETLIGLLEGLSNLKNNGVDIKREHFVTACKHLNNMGAITLLDTLDKNEISSIVENVLKKKFQIQ